MVLAIKLIHTYYFQVNFFLIVKKINYHDPCKKYVCYYFNFVQRNDILIQLQQSIDYQILNKFEILFGQF